jgi:phosphatidylinositol glycan class M
MIVHTNNRFEINNNAFVPSDLFDISNNLKHFTSQGVMVAMPRLLDAQKLHLSLSYIPSDKIYNSSKTHPRTMESQNLRDTMFQTTPTNPGANISKDPPTITNLFSNTRLILSISLLFRFFLLLWGEYQDTHSPLKYTDIDYLVFTDASRYLHTNQSPYLRDTYRYTPLLAWLLYPTAFGPRWFSFGKVVFAVGDVVTGYLIFLLLKQRMHKAKAMQYACIWLLNPMVANISTRGSSEGLLAVIVVGMLWAVETGRTRLGGCLLGLGVHFKIYPFVYAVSLVVWLDGGKTGGLGGSGLLGGLVNAKRAQLALFSFLTFSGLNMLMFRL